MRGTRIYAVGARAPEMPLPEPESTLASDPSSRLTTPVAGFQRRKMYRAMRCRVPGFAPICCDTNDPVTQVAGLKKRLLRDIPPPDVEILLRLKQFVRSFCEKNFRKVSQLDFEEWLAGTSYSEGRKNELRAARAQLRGGRPSRKDASRIKSFGKTEFYEVYKHLRWINSRNDRVKAYLGPFFKAVEEEVYKHPMFIKHIPVVDRPAYIASLMKDGRRYFLTDFTAFESHFLPMVMDAVECELYRFCLADSMDAEFICSILTGPNYLRTRAGVGVKVSGRRMSGDMCTSLGNGFTNLMLALFQAEEKGFKVEGYVEGDDGLFAVDDGELSAEYYRHAGWTIKLQEVENPLTCVPLSRAADTDTSLGSDPGEGAYKGAFCGVLCSEDLQIIRDPRKFMAGFGWTDSCIHAGIKVLDELQRAKALSAVYETPHCPIVGALARVALAQTRGVRPRFDSVNNYRSADVPRDESLLPAFAPTARTRELFARLFGISPATQIAVEERMLAGNLSVTDLVRPNAHMQHYESRYVEAIT